MRACIRDTEIFFDVEGAGLVADGSRMIERRVVFCVHGGPGIDHSGGKARYAPLAHKMQLVYFDHRGQGRSARGDSQKYTLDENVEDMEALRQYLGLGPIVSMGASYGGMVAMAHAARYPASVSHLILVATASHSGNLTRAKELLAERGTAEQVEQYRRVLAGEVDSAEGMREYFRILGPLYSRQYDPASAAGMGPTILAHEAFNRALGPAGFLRRFDLRPELRAISARTLIIGGRYDWVAAPEFSEEIHRLIPGSDLRIFQESGHTVASDEPEKFLDAVAGFLAYSS